MLSMQTVLINDAINGNAVGLGNGVAAVSGTGYGVYG